MQVTIHGPNLNDQSKGTFHVHTAECRDNSWEVRSNGSDHPSTIDAETVLDVVEFIYCDSIAEHPPSTVEDYVGDFHFAPCLKDLPYERAEAMTSEERELVLNTRNQLANVNDLAWPEPARTLIDKVLDAWDEFEYAVGTAEGGENEVIS